jgi:hypothetical protein
MLLCTVYNKYTLYVHASCSLQCITAYNSWCSSIIIEKIQSTSRLREPSNRSITGFRLHLVHPSHNLSTWGGGGLWLICPLWSVGSLRANKYQPGCSNVLVQYNDLLITNYGIMYQNNITTEKPCWIMMLIKYHKFPRISFYCILLTV